MDEVVLRAAQVTSGLLAGLYFAYAVSVMPALKRMPDQVFVDVMNTINVVIVNPVFLLLAFLGAPVTAVAYLFWGQPGCAIVGAVLGVVTLLISFAFNIPLNNALAKDNQREPFEEKWVRWNAVRFLTGTGSLVALLLV